MHPFPRRFHLVGFYLVSLFAWIATVQAASGTVEIDLVFPQNDTYAPAPIIPVAFAFQNSEFAGYLQPEISFSIIPFKIYSRALADRYYPMTWANFSSDPYVQYGDTLEILNTEGTWMLEWSLGIAHCSASRNLNVTGYDTRHRVIFTTKNGAKKPDLSAATQRHTFSIDRGVTFTIAET